MSDITVYTLKPFPWSRNGVDEEFAGPGETFDLPERLFDGLNKEGYVRRAVIGDGHFSLRQDVVEADRKDAVAKTEALVSELDKIGIIEKTPAPQPPVKTADLSATEQSAIDDGTWKALKYFSKRSIAAKLSDKPIQNAADADAAIEAYIASKG